MVRKLALGFLMAGLLTVSAVAGAFAASNPSGTGQPNQSCGSSTASTSPNGFNTGGFALAELVYAGSDGTHSAANANSPAAVSQYDVACYQVTSNH